MDTAQLKIIIIGNALEEKKQRYSPISLPHLIAYKKKIMSLPIIFGFQIWKKKKKKQQEVGKCFLGEREDELYMI